MGGFDLEHRERIKQYLKYSQPEWIGFLLVGLLGGFIFSLRFPGESFTLARWFSYFIWSTIVAGGSVLIRVSWQKIMALRFGYYVEFQQVWGASAISLLLAIVSLGFIPLPVFGSITTTFMVRHRLGEFRYGTSLKDTGMIIAWSVFMHIIIAALFAFLFYAFPNNLLFQKAIHINLLFALVTLFPLPTLDGMQLLFGNKFIYGVCVVTLLLFGSLLLSGTRIGLLICLIIGLIVGVLSYLWND